MYFQSTTLRSSSSGEFIYAGKIDKDIVDFFAKVFFQYMKI